MRSSLTLRGPWPAQRLWREEAQGIAVGVLEEGALGIPQRDNALLVGLHRALVGLLEDDAVRAELVHHRLDVVDIPAAERPLRLAGVARRGEDVHRRVPGALIGDAAVILDVATRQLQLALVELLGLSDVLD